MENDFVSSLMKECDFGLTTTPFQILGKSSVVVAMLEHGLSVIAYRSQIYGLPCDSVRDFHRGVLSPEEAQGEIKKWKKNDCTISYDPQQIADFFLKTLQPTRGEWGCPEKN